MTGPEAPDRGPLMAQHAQAKVRRDRAPLESDEYRAAAEEVARIETAIAALEEPSIAEAAAPSPSPPG